MVVRYRNSGENSDRTTDRSVRKLVKLFSVDEFQVQDDLTELERRIESQRSKESDRDVFRSDSCSGSVLRSSCMCCCASHHKLTLHSMGPVACSLINILPWQDMLTACALPLSLDGVMVSYCDNSLSAGADEDLGHNKELGVLVQMAEGLLD